MALKKRIFILTVFLLPLFTIRAQTNVYHPFPEDSLAHWTEYYWQNAGLGFGTDNYTLFFYGDTVIGGKNYHKVLKSGSQSGGGQTTYYYNNYACALRQDTAQKKVYCIMPSYPAQETVLYDFNLHVGDTAPNGYNRVLKIDSVLVGSSYHKRFLLKPLDSASAIIDTNYAIIEGVGGTCGLYQPLAYPFEEEWSLICFSNKNQNYPSTLSCYFNLGILQSNDKLFKVDVSPNPFSTQTVLQVDNLTEGVTISIYNCLGDIVKQLDNINQTIILQRDNLPSGLYFIKVVQNSQVVATKKLVVVD